MINNKRFLGINSMDNAFMTVKASTSQQTAC